MSLGAALHRNRSNSPLRGDGLKLGVGNAVFSKVLLSVSSPVKCLPNCFLCKWGHDHVGGVGWVHAIFSEILPNEAIFIHHGAEIVEIDASSIRQ
jgi:hypothetical protein